MVYHAYMSAVQEQAEAAERANVRPLLPEVLRQPLTCPALRTAEMMRQVRCRSVRPIGAGLTGQRRWPRLPPTP